MTRLGEIPAITAGGETVTLEEALQMLRADGRMKFLKDIVWNTVVRQAAAKEGVSVSDEELQQAADDFHAIDFVTVQGGANQ